MTEPEPAGLWRIHDPSMPLAGVRVLDAATVLAGPGMAARLGDFGADVIKVEHPSGDTTRTMGWAVDGVTLWSKWVNRNKRPITLNLSVPAGQDLLQRLAATADVLIESFRPGTLERWNLSRSACWKRTRGWWSPAARDSGRPGRTASGRGSGRRPNRSRDWRT